MLKHKLKAYTAALDEKSLKRSPSLMLNHCLDFSRNDYLALTTNQHLKTAYQIGFERYPTGSTGSMLVSGYHETHQALEAAFVQALQVDAALLFPSGYAANLSIMQLLAKLNIHALIDKNMHASVYDGLALSGGTYTRYRDIAQLNQKKSTCPNDTVIMTEGIFSMHGEAPDLNLFPSNYPLIIDEAHAFGVLGPQGLGSVAAHGLTQTEVPLRIIPFGKALGGAGAMVAGDKAWITALLQAARPLIYSTAMSPALAYGLNKAFELLRAADSARLNLHANIRQFKQHIKNTSLTWANSDTPIQQLRLGCPQQANAYMLKLQEKNIRCIAMREPTVKRADTGLRIVLNSRHTAQQIQQLFTSLEQCKTSI
ncbi:MAG: aminotransferase class I/II-fold pyridoxal phosphate-dependent enzyme [Gammaproteobacteria bacterium]|nr:aminotransferase class I/II-fold pyridoxal phosphate-dependent enzyme [Gammaproteobacteria bacterium]MCH9763824.1 aminotransferase class I/II-fold pyridoxal phosphate-dependent enzyme [Gammaproteobacteria bacterium]